MFQTLLKLFLQNWGRKSQKSFEMSQLSLHNSAGVCHGHSAGDRERSAAVVVTVAWEVCPGSQGYSSPALLLLGGGCQHGQQLCVLLVRLVPLATKTASTGPLLWAGCREPAEQKEDLLQRSLFWVEPWQSEWFPLSYSLFLPCWHFGVINLSLFPKSSTHFSVILHCVSGWSAVGLLSSCKTSSKQQLKYIDVSFLFCVMSHSSKNNSKIHTREIYFLRDEQMIVKNTKIEK